MNVEIIQLRNENEKIGLTSALRAIVECWGVGSPQFKPSHVTRSKSKNNNKKCAYTL